MGHNGCRFDPLRPVLVLQIIQADQLHPTRSCVLRLELVCASFSSSEKLGWLVSCSSVDIFVPQLVQTPWVMH